MVGGRPIQRRGCCEAPGGESKVGESKVCGTLILALLQKTSAFILSRVEPIHLCRSTLRVEALFGIITTRRVVRRLAGTKSNQASPSALGCQKVWVDFTRCPSAHAPGIFPLLRRGQAAYGVRELVAAFWCTESRKMQAVPGRHLAAIRTWSLAGAFRSRTRTVVRPIAVSPTIRTPSHAKCSCH